MKRLAMVGAAVVAAVAVAFESVPPVRSFPVYRGRRNNTGLWWSATTGGARDE